MTEQQPSQEPAVPRHGGKEDDSFSTPPATKAGESAAVMRQKELEKIIETIGTTDEPMPDIHAKEGGNDDN